MWDQIAEVEAIDGTKHIISCKSSWSNLEVIAYAGLVWRYRVKIISRIDIQP